MSAAKPVFVVASGAVRYIEGFVPPDAVYATLLASIPTMPLYELTADAFRPIAEASFTEMQVRERDDLQRLLRTQIEVLSDDLYVLTEEFSDWEDSSRRIDLLAVDSEANLVVIELKRTSHGGHMELQAIRYASMVSAMTFERAVQVHGEFLAKIGEPRDEAESRLLDFLGWDEPSDDTFAADVRIVLVSEDFGKELTTAVLWLRDRDIDISCIRLRPYRDGQTTMVDVQQIIPLPEAQDYQVQLREKEQSEKKRRTDRSEKLLAFWKGVVALTRDRGGLVGRIPPSHLDWTGVSAGVPGLFYHYVVARYRARVELYFKTSSADENKRRFDRIFEQREQIEGAFGQPLTWERLDGKTACRVRLDIRTAGYESPESDWPQLQRELADAMTRLVDAMSPAIASLG